MVLNRLRRITRDGRWIPEIDGLRFVAIGSVFLYHLLGELVNRSGRYIPVDPQYWWLFRIIGNGDRGVRLFFVISGMILALPFARQMLAGARAVSIRKFYLRRLTRLEPPYIFSLVIAVLMEAVYAHGHIPGFLPHFFASLFYVHNQVYRGMSSINPIAWSLEVEIQFYLIAPLVMKFFLIPGAFLRRCSIILLILAIGLTQLPFHSDPRVYGSILFYFQYFLAGLLVADVFVVDLDRMPSSWLWDLAGLSAVALMSWPDHDALWAHIVLPLVIAVLMIAVMRSHLIRRIFATPWVAVIGGMCYSIYLFHLLLIAVVFKVTRMAILPHADFLVNYLIQLVVMGIPVLALCTLVFVLVERPCMDPDWPSKLWHLVTGRSEREVAALDSAGVSE
jgi:peptidoglycan/LPS O-acetylase OafA/YrhL